MHETQLKKENEDIEEAEVETLDFTKPDYSFTPQGAHGWRQQGYYLVCKSCEIEHAVWVGADKLMVGLDEQGRPRLKLRKNIGMA